MKTIILICILCALGFTLIGCATSSMDVEKTLADGSVIKYRVNINSLGQDFNGSDLQATLDPEGKTSMKAGAVQSETSQVTADVAKSMVELFTAMLPYLQPVPVAP